MVFDQDQYKLNLADSMLMKNKIIQNKNLDEVLRMKVNEVNYLEVLK